MSRLRSMGGDVTFVTPDFNDTMKATCEQLFDTKGQEEAKKLQDGIDIHQIFDYTRATGTKQM